MPIASAGPVVERIAVELLNRLRQLEAGYADASAVVEVIRPTRLGNYTPKHLQIVLTQDSPEQADELNRPGNPPAVAWEQRFNIRCHVMPSELDPVSIDEYINSTAADIVRVVTASGVGWHTFNDLAIDARFDALEMMEADGGIDGFNLPLRVLYRTSELTPYDVRY